MFLSGVNKENIYIANTCLAIACPEASGSIQCQMIGEGKKESEMKMELFYRDVIILDSKTSSLGILISSLLLSAPLSLKR